MNKLIELFDCEKTLLNLLASQCFQPRQLLFLTDPKQDDSNSMAAVIRTLTRMHPQMQVETMPVSYQDAAGIAASCHIASEGGAAFHLSGGNGLAAAVVSRFCAKNEYPAFYIDSETLSFTDLGGAAEYAAEFEPPSLTLEDLAQANGLSVGGNMHRAPEPAQFDDILLFFRLTAQNGRGWRQFCNYLQEITDIEKKDAQGHVCVDAPTSVQSTRHKTLRLDPEFAGPAYRCGFFEHYRIEGNRVKFSYPDMASCYYMITQGVWLEMFLYIMARQTAVFDDSRMSVLFNWNRPDGSPGNVVNEIDAVFVQGVTPLFFSCKTSVPTTADLNEIFLYAKRFGGSHAKAALATTTSIKQIPGPVKNRAGDMGVFLLPQEALSVRRLENFFAKATNKVPARKHS